MFEWLIEKIFVALGSIAISSFLVSIGTFMIIPVVTMFVAVFVATSNKIKNRAVKILIVLLPALYFASGIVGFFLFGMWMAVDI